MKENDKKNKFGFKYDSVRSSRAAILDEPKEQMIFRHMNATFPNSWHIELVENTIAHNANNNSFMFKWAINMELMSHDELESLLHRALFVQQLRHDNIFRIVNCEIVHNYMYVYSLSYSLGNCETALKFKYNNGMPLDTVISVVRDVAAALNYLHAQNILHNRLCGRNILVCGSGQVALSGFDEAVQLSPRARRLAPDCADLYKYAEWRSPEMLRQSVLGVYKPSDVYSLGVTFLELLFGRTPFFGFSPLRMLHTKLFLDTSVAAKAICIFTDKYFFKSNTGIFFSNLFCKAAPMIDYGYMQVFLKITKKGNFALVRSYKLVTQMLKKAPDERPTIIKILEDPLFKRV